MTTDPRFQHYEYAMDALAAGDVVQLEELAALDAAFPHGVDGFLGRRWIINAIDGGNPTTVRWMLQRGVELRFRDDEGYTPLHCAIERSGDDRHAILRLLLEHGADVNLKGINDYTPAHMAAVRNDVDALRLLVEFKADLTIRSNIDDCATPLEEAQLWVFCRHTAEAVAYLRSVVGS